jgi:YVTN family beta-propeller protein
VSLDQAGEKMLSAEAELLGADDVAREYQHSSDDCEPAEAVLATISLGGTAADIAVSPDSDRVYVITDRAVAVIDRSPEVVAVVAIPGDPKALWVNADGSKVYVAGYGGPVSVIETADYTVSTISAQSSTAEVLSPEGRHFYMADFTGHHGRISVVDSDGRPIAAVDVDNHITGMAVSPDGSRLYAGTSDRGSYYQYDKGSLAVIDTAGYSVIDSITLGVCPDTVAVSPDGSRIYVTHPDSKSVSAVDIATRRVTTVALQDVPLSMAVCPDGTHVYVSCLHTLAVIDAAADLAEAITVGDAPRGVQISPDGKRAYITNFGGHSVSVVDTTSSTITTIDVGGHPEVVAVSPDGERVFVSDYWSGNLAVIAIPSVSRPVGRNQGCSRGPARPVHPGPHGSRPRFPSAPLGFVRVLGSVARRRMNRGTATT